MLTPAQISDFVCSWPTKRFRQDVRNLDDVELAEVHVLCYAMRTWTKYDICMCECSRRGFLVNESVIAGEVNRRILGMPDVLEEAS